MMIHTSIYRWQMFAIFFGIFGTIALLQFLCNYFDLRIIPPVVSLMLWCPFRIIQKPPFLETKAVAGSWESALHVRTSRLDCEVEIKRVCVADSLCTA